MMVVSIEVPVFVFGFLLLKAIPPSNLTEADF